MCLSFFSYHAEQLTGRAELGENPPQVLWRNTQRAVPFWRDTLKASEFLLRAIQFGVYEKTDITSTMRTRYIIPSIPMDPSEKEWLKAELREALERRIYEEVPWQEALASNRRGFPISNAFGVHQDEKRGLVVNLARQSTLFRDRPVTMETLEAFSLDLNPSDHLLSLEISRGYHHFRLHPSILDWFIFRIA